MMTCRKLGAYVHAGSFRPYRIRMGSGPASDICQPQVFLARRTLARIARVIGTEANARSQNASLLLTVAPEPLDAQLFLTKGECVTE